MTPPRKRGSGKAAGKKKAAPPGERPVETHLEKPEVEPPGLEAMPVSGAVGGKPPVAELEVVTPSRAAGGGGPTTPAGQTPPLGFAEFFQAVGKGMVDAQLALCKFGDPGGAGLQALHDTVLVQGKSQAEFLSRTRV